MANHNEQLRTTREFWDANPCGVHSDYEQQRDQRYAMEPWLPDILRTIAARHSVILEVGCGQGIDAITLMSAMAPATHYTGIDYSPQSVEVAQRNSARMAGRLSINREFQVGNAEALAFADRRFDAVYSMGVLHHTADERAAIREIHRVLTADGHAYILLYRKYSPKVAVAKTLRGIQRGLDFLLGTDRCVYQLLRRRGSDTKLFGTMFHECFGVPYLKCYSRGDVEALFSAFSDVSVTSIGANLGRFALRGGKQPGPLGYFWYIHAVK